MNCPSIDSDRQSFLFFEIDTIAICWNPFDSSIISILSFLIPRLDWVYSYTFAAAELPDERYVCVGYFHGCSHVFALGGSVHSAAEIRDTPEHPYMERRV